MAVRGGLRKDHVRGAAVKRGGALRRRAARKPAQPAFDAHWEMVRAQVWTRAGGLCDCCTAALDPDGWACHHRKLRSRRGRDDPANCVALTHPCHDRVHRNPTWATERGLMVPSGMDPATTPVFLRGRVWAHPGVERWLTSTARTPPTTEPTTHPHPCGGGMPTPDPTPTGDTS
jgi:hypothetical protein